MKRFFPCILLFSFAAAAPAAIEFQTSPVWISSDERCSTGGVAADIDQDGFCDFIVSNGNDITREPEVIYFGNGTGLSTTPGWTSSDLDYSGHCSVGDIDGDGLLDLAVGNYIESTQGFTPGTTKIYFNGSAGLETEPSWISPDLNNTFRVTLADVDLDGDLDLACANGESYSDRPQANEIYFNIDGVIESAPGWLSGDIDCSYDVQFEDVDLDGDLDMAVANSKSPTRLYYNEESVLEVFASWSADVADNDNSLAWSDINGDDWPDLSVITNEQLNGSGLIKIYINHEGTLDITPSYTIEIPQSGYGSALCWADFDRDMDEDLAVGSWWGPLAVFENDDGQLQQEPSWQSDNTFVAEALSTIPISSPVISCDEFLLANHPGVYRLSSHPVFGVVNITIGGKPLNPNSYALDNRKGILTMDTDAIPGMVMTVCYRTAWTEYLVATSWGNHNAHGPNFGYLNTSNLPTPTPTVTPTAPPPFRKLSIIMNATDFFRGDLFDCQISIVNQNESFTGDLFFLIEIEGSFYFYPQFDTDLHFERISVDKSSVKTIQILKFNFPDPIGYDGTISLYSALFFPDTYDLICSYDWVRVYLHE